MSYTNVRQKIMGTYEKCHKVLYDIMTKHQDSPVKLSYQQV